MFMKKLICAATSFGYGPVTKLLTICRALNLEENELYFVGNGIALNMVQKTSFFKGIYDINFENINYESCPKEIVKLIEDSDVMLNVLQPTSVEIAQFCNIPVIYVDSLFWMWDKIPDFLKKVDAYFVQKYFDIDERVNLLKRDISNLIICDPIITSLTTDMNTKLDQVIFNFSGLETPFTKDIDDLLLYPKVIFENAYEALNESNFDRIIVTGNEKVMIHLKKEYGDKFRGEFSHLSHAEFLIELQNSKMLVTSPGLTVTYEAMSCNVPVRFLPPQNYSQALMIKKYIEIGLADKYFDFTDIYDDYQIERDMPEEIGVALVKDIILRFSEDSTSSNIAKSAIQSILTENVPNIKKQKELLEFTDSLGTEKIVEMIQNIYYKGRGVSCHSPLIIK